MEVKVQKHEECRVVKISGRVDANTSPELTGVLNEIMDAEIFKIVIEMSDVEFISSAGTRALMETQKECTILKRGAVIIAAPNERVMRTFELSMVKHYIRIEENATDALEVLGCQAE